MTRDEALAICFANLKGSRTKQLVETARALDYLLRLPEYGSQARVAEVVGVSREIVREFLSLLSLPHEVQMLIEAKGLGLEQGRRLAQLGNHRPDQLVEAAEAMQELTSLDGRALVDYLVRHPDVTVDQAKTHVSRSKPVRKREYHVVAIVNEQDFRILRKEAQRRRQGESELVTDIVSHWVRSRIEHE